MLNVRAILLLVILATFTQVTSAQPEPTIEQCRTTANDLLNLSPAKFAELQKRMTAGDELVYSTQLAKCIEKRPSVLSPAQADKLDRITYQLDADVIGRMYGFLERHKMANRFNDEEEARKSK